MRQIAFLSPKGGVGKTTAALLLAVGLLKRGMRVAVVDADPNKPLVQWAALAGRPDGFSVHAAPTAEDFPTALREAQRDTPDWIVIDTEGSPRGAMAFRQARPRLIITPLSPSPLEVEQALKTAELLRPFTQSGRILHRGLLTRMSTPADGRDIAPTVARLRNGGMGLLLCAVLENPTLKTLFSSGAAWLDLEASALPGVEQARANGEALAQAVEELVNA